MSKNVSLVASFAGLVVMGFLSGGFPLATAGEEAQSGWMGRTRTVAASEVINRDYFAFAPLVTISGTINGDVYALGGQVLIDGRVNGDVLVGAGRVSISGNVSQDARIMGGQVSVSGNIARNVTVSGGNVELTRAAVVQGSLVAAGGNIHVAAPIAKGAKIAAGTLIVSNRIGGNLDAAVGTLKLTSNAEVQGDVHYVSRREASVDSGARIQGQLSRTLPPKIPRPAPEKAAAFLAAGTLFLMAVSLVSTLVLGLLSVRFLPQYHGSVVAILRERPWASLGVGFIAGVVTPVVCVLLFATVFGFPIGLILAAAYLIILYWARIFVVTRIGEAIFGIFRAKPSQGWAFILGLVVYYLVALIPLIGWLMVVLVLLFGLGAELIGRKEFYVAARRQEMI